MTLLQLNSDYLGFCIFIRTFSDQTHSSRSSITMLGFQTIWNRIKIEKFSFFPPQILPRSTTHTHDVYCVSLARAECVLDMLGRCLAMSKCDDEWTFEIFWRVFDPHSRVEVPTHNGGPINPSPRDIFSFSLWRKHTQNTLYIQSPSARTLRGSAVQCDVTAFTWILGSTTREHINMFCTVYRIVHKGIYVMAMRADFVKSVWVDSRDDDARGTSETSLSYECRMSAGRCAMRRARRRRQARPATTKAYTPQQHQNKNIYTHTIEAPHSSSPKSH